MTGVYISFDRIHDNDFSYELAEHLSQMGLTVFIGDEPAASTILNSDHVLLVLSSHTLESGAVRGEIEQALAQDKPVVPLILGSADVHIPPDLHELTSYTPLRFDFENPDAALNRLKRVLSPEFERRSDVPETGQRKKLPDVAPAPVQRMIPMVIIAGSLFCGLMVMVILRALAPLTPEANEFVIDPTALIAPPTPTQAIAENLQVLPDDQPDVVIGKAIILRQIGELEAAIDAFEQYGLMFASTDPTAPLYAQIAAQFTRLITGSATQGGAYIAAVEAGSVADQNGFLIGDIITRFDGQTVNNQLDLRRFLDNAEQGATVDVTFLRRDTAGNFSEFTVPVTLFEKNFGATLYAV